MSAVLDSSAVLALLFNEPGSEAVAASLRGAALSAANASEVLAVLVREGATIEQADASLGALGLAIIAADLGFAALAAALYPPTRRAGLSLGDRFCLALARQLGRPVLTADRNWSRVAEDVGVELRLIR